MDGFDTAGFPERFCVVFFRGGASEDIYIGSVTHIYILPWIRDIYERERYI